MPYVPRPDSVETISPTDEWREGYEEGQTIQATTFGCSCCSGSYAVPRDTDDLLNILNARLDNAERDVEHYRTLLRAFETGGYDAVLAEIQV